ncbi:Xaa-Pro aminopeptidase [Paraperlucidibaca sp.]|uniref:Xaa-Pro aminopeptidase n=1 Tax=Paraperlucidibaca sp. TaxID=2708021 RepID=UPI00398A27D9|tara:strand:+ start:26826 stop:28148 length:1323 start_codon:yes stop_codon:yes gene_type:complete
MTVRISPEEFACRRQALMARVGRDAAVIIPAAVHHRRNRDTEYRYRQDSDFYYLTGFAEPEALLVLLPGRAEGEFVLFCRDRDRAMEIWNGYRAGPEGAVSDFGASQAFVIADVATKLPELLAGRKQVYAPMATETAFDADLAGWINAVRSQARAGVEAPQSLHAIDQALHPLRLIKSAAEIAIMQAAADLSAEGHRRAMAVAKAGRYEYELEAELLHSFTRHGCIAPAYGSIVGGGANACILHYTENNAELRDGDLVLIDAGGELAYYAADITRTFPVNGRFSAEQKALYEVVLAAQLAAIDVVQVGNSWQLPHETAVRVLCEGLLELGLLKGELSAVIEAGDYRRFYMHRTGHWLGMDVHDVGDYRIDGEWRAFAPGMVLTVEPGLYIAPDDDTVEARWRGIGIRIEDDVVVTESGPHVLTAKAPKTIAEIEALVGSA